ncbi:glycosyltransferase [Streptomyces sp. WZ-12]|uniref:glycosyltransferase n=1 Tax=Streptomyces sp. WZ-12 TaxID=3030210 RepID=UPI00406C196E
MDFASAASQLRDFFLSNVTTELHCIGTDYASYMHVPRRRIRFTPPTDPENFLRAIDFHVGIAPLKHHAFNHSKSALKIIECGALGIPVVASAVEPYEATVRHGITGYLVRSNDDWRKYLHALIYDSDLRTALGAEAKAQAEQYAISRLATLWEKVVLQ